MATKWYFRNTQPLVSYSQALPSAKASTDTDSFNTVPSDKNTPKNMGVSLGGIGGGIGSRKGNTQATVTGAYSSASSPLYTLTRIFVSPPLRPITLKGGVANCRTALAIKESSGSMNLYARFFVYVYRPWHWQCQDYCWSDERYERGGNVGDWRPHLFYWRSYGFRAVERRQDCCRSVVGHKKHEDHVIHGDLLVGRRHRPDR